jgi:hypothetical protein
MLMKLHELTSHTEGNTSIIIRPFAAQLNQCPEMNI